MYNEDLIFSTRTKVTNGYRVVIITPDEDIIISDYRSLSSALFRAGFDFAQKQGQICRIYYIQKNAVTYLKQSYVQCYGKVY